MDILNRQERSTNIKNFILSYLGFGLMLTILLFYSIKRIPELDSKNQKLAESEITGMLAEHKNIEGIIQGLEAQPVLNDGILQPFYDKIQGAKAKFPQPVFGAVASSDESVVVELANLKNNSDPEVQELVKTKQDLLNKKNQLIADIAAAKKNAAPAPAPKPAAAAPLPPPVAAVAAAGSMLSSVSMAEVGPVKLRKVRGSGDFDFHDVAVRILVSLVLSSDGSKLSMRVKFDANDLSSPSGTMGTGTRMEIIYSTPAGYKIDPSSLPQTIWSYNYTDRNTSDENYDTPDGFLSFTIKGLTSGMDTDNPSGGSAVLVSMNRKLPIKLVKM